ncbi:MAG: Asp-tRNA(Asn)/Glu-tRNA(Gln) amidotransferase GatCAB subunit B, partial [Chloroflexi bacterium]|nr:Asp-tRNA(Asn)/Glu-tRNA(Gln) amidotransferase GatCAB subunit B [Chloroflexota bacterium]
PPLVVDDAWIAEVRETLPELPVPRFHRFRQAFGLSEYDADVLVAEKDVADYFERVVAAASGVKPKTIVNWLTSDLFGLMNDAGVQIGDIKVTPSELGALLQHVRRGEINKSTGKRVLGEMFATGQPAAAIIEARGLKQVSDESQIEALVSDVLAENPEQVQIYLNGKETIVQWLFGQV